MLKIPTEVKLFDAAAQGLFYGTLREVTSDPHVSVDIMVSGQNALKPTLGFHFKWTQADELRELTHTTTGTSIISSEIADPMTAAMEGALDALKAEMARIRGGLS